MNEEVQKLVATGKINSAEGKKLETLTPGTCCKHKSWGLGKIESWDTLGDRMLINFIGKPGHPLKLSFAISSLTPLPPEHFLAKCIDDVEGMKSLAKTEPTQIVEQALRSSGGKLLISDFEDMVKDLLVPEGEYKRWWDKTKKAAAPLRHLVIPSKRNEPMLLREDEAAAGLDIVDSFLKARDLKSKLAALKSISADFDLISDPAESLKPIFQDLSDTVRRAARLQLKEGLQLLLSRDALLEQHQLGDPPMGSMKVSDLLSESKENLSEAVSSLPAALLGRVFRAFPAAFPDGWVQECLNQLTRTGGRAVAEIASILEAHNETAALADYLRKAVRNRRLSPDLLIWLCKERNGAATAVFSTDLGHAILDAIQADHLEGGPRKTGRLLDAFADDPLLLGEMVAKADEQEARQLAKRIFTFTAFDELSRRSLMAKIIKQRPEFQDIVADSVSQQEDNTLIVSWESLERRKKELEELIQVKIPQNKKDIEIARGYGDLRENFEYKSAKQQQAVLQRMQGEYQRDIDRAQGTDFTNTDTATVGIGTIVDLEDTGTGATETYTILGAWDGDVEKNIISYLSEAAKALIGNSIGAEVELPTDSANVTRRVRITAIRAFATT
jgi:transcription elongation GreA/GreB family factor